MYKIGLFIICVIWSTLGCSQAQQEDKSIPMPKESKDITADNFVDRMASEIQHYDKEPRYFIRPLQHNCVYEILVNDMLVYKEYSIEKLATPISINHFILQSGPQTVTVRLYPLGDAMKRAYGEGESIQTLLKKTKMEVSVVKYEAYNISKSLDDEIEVIRHTSPTRPGTQEFIGAGLPYYEYTFEFEAVVPYQNKGWLDGEDLTQFNKEELEQQVKRCYISVQEVYNKKRIDDLARINYNAIQLISTAKYNDKQEITEIWEEIEGNINYKNKDFGVLEHYVMQLYGNGRVVALRHPSHEPIDHRLRGESALWFKYDDDDGDISVFFPGLFLYVPKEKSLDSMQVIF